MPKAALEIPGLEDVLTRFSEIESLQSEVKEHVIAIQGLFARIAQAVGSDGRGAGRSSARGGRSARGGLRGLRAAGGPRRRALFRGKRAKRGALKAAIHKVLARGKLASPIEIVKALPRTGYRTQSKPRVFYNTVYLSLRGDKSIEKVGEKYRLRK